MTYRCGKNDSTTLTAKTTGLVWSSLGLSLTDYANIPEFLKHNGTWACLDCIPCEFPQASVCLPPHETDWLRHLSPPVIFQHPEFSMLWHSGWAFGSSSWRPADTFDLRLKLNFSKTKLHFVTGKYNPATVDIIGDSTNNFWCALHDFHWHTFSQQGHCLPRSCYLSSI